MKDIAIADREFLLLFFVNHLFLYGLFLQVMDPVNLVGGKNLNLLLVDPFCSSISFSNSLLASSNVVNILKQFNYHSKLNCRIHTICGTWTCDSSRREWNYEPASFENSICNIIYVSCSSIALTPRFIQFCISLGDLTSAEDDYCIENVKMNDVHRLKNI